MRNNYKNFVIGVFSLLGIASLYAEPISIAIDGNGETHRISPYVYGKNNSTSDDTSKVTTEEAWTQINESGVMFLRENSGNNSTKYNYRRHLSSHPDWYNNVEYHNWDYELELIQERAPQVQAMYGFQLLGQVAETRENNFPDWDWYINHNKTWLNRSQNVAGIGGVPNPDDGKTALVEGDPESYLMPWPADSTVGIIDHWFGENGLGFDRSKVQYWAMDNEPEIWSGTHDDIQKEPVTADEFIEKYIAVAKAAKSKWPEIKLVGPITCNEWQWYAGSDNKGVPTEEKTYTWVEYFIKRIAEEEKKCGMKLLDVFALHFYPKNLSDAEVIQCHRIYFDEQYDYPQANGIKRISGKWDNNSTKEYILKRCQNWMQEHMGEKRPVGVTETGIESSDANIVSIWYGSTIGEFMKEGAEMFSPWSWKSGMWETLHLFARYNQPFYLHANSSNDSLVSVHATISESKDSLSVLLINRSLSESKEATIQLSNYNVEDGEYQMLELSDLPENETFVSHSINALKEKKVVFEGGRATVSLPPLSTSTIILSSVNSSKCATPLSEHPSVYPTSAHSELTISDLKGECLIQIISTEGKVLSSKMFAEGSHRLDISSLKEGYYFCAITEKEVTHTVRFLKK